MIIDLRAKGVWALGCAQPKMPEIFDWDQPKVPEPFARPSQMCLGLWLCSAKDA